MTNFVAALAQSEAAMEIFREQDAGHFVMISSMSAMRGMPKTMTTYAATKAGVAHLAEGLRNELYGKPIKVTVLYPGYISSEMNERVDPKKAKGMVSTEKGVRSMVAAIEKEVDSACVPPLPWAPMSLRHEARAPRRAQEDHLSDRGQAEPGQHGVLEAGQGGDLVVRQGQHHEPGAVEDPVRRAGVEAEGRLAVGPGRDRPVDPAHREEELEEVGDDVTTVVLVGQRRHREEHVVGEEADQAVEVAGLVGADEPGDQLVLRRRGRPGWRSAPSAQGRAGPGALQRAVDRVDRRLQHLGHLAGAEAEDVTQEQHGDLARGRCCRAVTKASEMDSDCSYLTSGRESATARGRRGSAPARRSRPGAWVEAAASVAPRRSLASRRLCERRAFRHWLVAMR